MLDTRTDEHKHMKLSPSTQTTYLLTHEFTQNTLIRLGLYRPLFTMKDGFKTVQMVNPLFNVMQTLQHSEHSIEMIAFGGINCNCSYGQKKSSVQLSNRRNATYITLGGPNKLTFSLLFSFFCLSHPIFFSLSITRIILKFNSQFNSLLYCKWLRANIWVTKNPSDLSKSPSFRTNNIQSA